MIISLKKMKVNMNSKKCCDTCFYYRWYYDFCKLWKIKVDLRAICSNYKEKENEISEMYRM